MGHTHPVCTSCGDRLRAAGVWSSCLFLFTAPGRVFLAELENGFCKTVFIKTKTKYFFDKWQCLEKCINFNIISMANHFENKKSVDLENVRI